MLKLSPLHTLTHILLRDRKKSEGKGQIGWRGEEEPCVTHDTSWVLMQGQFLYSSPHLSIHKPEANTDPGPVTRAFSSHPRPGEVGGGGGAGMG